MRAAVLLGLLFVSAVMAWPLPTSPLNPDHPSSACTYPTHVRGAGWDLCWQQQDARAQGIELTEVHFQGEKVLHRIGLPMTLTNYEGSPWGPFKDTLGSPGSGGHPGFGLGAMPLDEEDCPRFHQFGMLLNNDRLCAETRDGPEEAIVVWAKYNVYNYRFLQGYSLDSRGDLEPFLRLGGLLIDGDGGEEGLDHFHHVYWRIDAHIASGDDGAFSLFLAPTAASGSWQPGNANMSGHPLVPEASPLPSGCAEHVEAGKRGWCRVANESKMEWRTDLAMRWRVEDTVLTNGQGHGRSYESWHHSDAAVDGDFVTFDLMALEHGPAAELGYVVPTVPVQGDAYLDAYLDPAEAIADPVAWVAMHVLHDPRDEDRGTMSYHDASFVLRPRNFVDQNPGEATFP